MVTHQDLLGAAVRLVCESGVSGQNPDYADRAPFILASFCNQHEALDAAWREAHGMEPGTYTPGVQVTMNASFAFCDEFIDAAESYLASMLVIDENDELSEKFFDLYSDAVCSIRATLPAARGKIKNAYPGLI